MTTAAWLTLIAIGGFVWGGFALLITIALRKERAKRASEPGPWVP